MNVRDRLSLVTALAVLLACSALQPVFATLDWLPRTAGAVVVVALASALARRLPLPRVLAPVLPLVVLAGYLAVVFAPATLRGGVLPAPGTVRAFRALLTASGTDLAQYAPPAPATTPLVLLVVGGVGLVAVVVDAVAATARRPAVAGLPLLALFAVPSAVLPDGLGWLPFVLGAGGWLALLLVEGREQASRWGTPVRSAGGDSGVGRVGRRIGGVALGVAVLVPALLPGLDGRLFDGGGGGGGGSGGTRSVTTYNPITRLRGELTLPQPVEVLHYRSDDASPDYLRMTTLGVYDGAGWRQEVLRGNLRDNGVNGAQLPVPLGREAGANTRAVTTRVTVDDLDAFWLPAPATPDRVQVSGPWMWDAGSGSVFATRSNTGKVKDYTVQSTRVLPDGAALVAGDDLVPAQVQPYAAPVEATPRVKATTKRVTERQTTQYGKALALQAYFRSGLFSYDEQTTTGGSPDALEDFLVNKRGFCEQYASAMAAMLRLSGVPARVAVGFTAGTRQDDGSFVVTTSDAHAWPEAWFAGLGWVRFEPTPSTGGVTPPSYGPVPAPAQASPGQGAAAGPSATADDPDAGETPAQRHQRLLDAHEQVGPDASAPATAAPSQDGGRPVREVGAGVLLLLVAASPALLHAARRRRRWRVPTAGTAWAQLADDATDTGQDWRLSDSPRSAAGRLVDGAGLDGEAAAAVQRLTAAVERERFARPGGATPSAGDGLAADSAGVRRALHARASRARKVRAVLLPPSTVRWASSRLGSRTADLLDGLDRALAALGARLHRHSGPRAGRGPGSAAGEAAPVLERVGG